MSTLPCTPPEKKLDEFSVEEDGVLQILTQVNVVRRECEIVSIGKLVLGGQGAPSKMGTPVMAFPSLLETGGSQL